MDIIYTARERAHALLDEIDGDIDRNSQLEKISNYLDKAIATGKEQKEDQFKQEWRMSTSKFITRWFAVQNIVVLSLIIIAFAVDLLSDAAIFQGSLVTPSVLIALIGGTVAQTAAVFILFTRYSINMGPNKD